MEPRRTLTRDAALGASRLIIAQPGTQILRSSDWAGRSQQHSMEPGSPENCCRLVGELWLEPISGQFAYHDILLQGQARSQLSGFMSVLNEKSRIWLRCCEILPLARTELLHAVTIFSELPTATILHMSVLSGPCSAQWVSFTLCTQLWFGSLVCFSLLPIPGFFSS